MKINVYADAEARMIHYIYTMDAPAQSDALEILWYCSYYKYVPSYSYSLIWFGIELSCSIPTN